MWLLYLTAGHGLSRSLNSFNRRYLATWWTMAVDLSLLFGAAAQPDPHRLAPRKDDKVGFHPVLQWITRKRTREVLVENSHWTPNNMPAITFGTFLRYTIVSRMAQIAPAAWSARLAITLDVRGPRKYCRSAEPAILRQRLLYARNLNAPISLISDLTCRLSIM